MTKRGFLIVAGLASLVFWAPVGAGKERVTKSYLSTPIRVLLERGKRDATLQSENDHVFVNSGSGWTQLGKTVRVSVIESDGESRLAIDGRIVTTRQAYFRGGAHPTDPLRFKQEKYHGAVKAILDSKELTLTNVISVEDYLGGTLAAEMSPSWELEALKAQAVASRSYAFYMIKHPKSTYYDLEKSTQDQVYKGADRGSARINEAIKATEGEYLAESIEPVKAYYHSRCGGSTETTKNVWNQSTSGYKTRVSCPFCLKNRYAWKASMGLDELTRLLKLPLQKMKQLRLAILQRSPSGRVDTIKAAAQGKDKVLSSDHFRSSVGYTRIKSAFFNWKLLGDKIEFSGVGSGHGVGMCQWGARYLAQQGKGYRQILTHFYPNLSIQASRDTLAEHNPLE